MRKLGSVLLLCAVVLLVGSCTVKVGTKAQTGETTGPKPEAKGPATTAAGAPEKPGSTVETSEASPKVVVLKVGDEYDEQTGTVSHQTRTFHPESPEMHIAAGIKGVPSGAKIKGSLRAIEITGRDGTVMRDIAGPSEELDAPAAETTVHFKFTAPTAGWLPGSYAIDLAVNGEVIETIDVTVAEATEAGPSS